MGTLKNFGKLYESITPENRYEAVATGTRQENTHAVRERPNLAEILARVTPENLPDVLEFETIPRGQEIW
jgi:hypothetical protein